MVDFSKHLKSNMKKETKDASNLRAQFKAASIKSLRKQVDEDNEMVGAQSNEYLNLEDGKTVKIRLFPPHPGLDNFYFPKKCYWLSVEGNDGDLRRTTVNDSVVHGGTAMDICDQYIKFGKKKWAKDAERLSHFSGQDSLSPQYTWMCYADKVKPDEELRAKLWEVKKTVRDQLNNLAFTEEEGEPIEVDPFTDPDEGLPINVKYLKKPNKKKGENYYDTTFPKKVTARPLTDEELEYFAGLKPLNEIIPLYNMRDFEKALQGLQNFDEENDMQLFEDEDWLEIVEKVKAQYDSDEEDDKPVSKKTGKKTVKKVEEPEDEDEEDEKPAKKAAKKPSKKVVEEEDEDEDEEEPAPKKKTKKAPEPEPEDEEEDEDEEEEDEEEEDLDSMSRDELKAYIKSKGLDISIKKSMDEDDLRAAIKTAMSEESEEDEEEDEDEEEKPAKSKLTLSDIRKKIKK